MKILALLLTLTAYPTAWAECISGDCENGTGTFADPDGWTYVGEFLDGKKHGKGTSTCGSECEPVELVGYKYVGDFRDDNLHGEGTLTLPGGFKYIGDFRNNNLHGEGTRTLPDGEKYVGEFRDSVSHGEGTKTFADLVHHACSEPCPLAFPGVELHQRKEDSTYQILGQL